MSRQSGFKAIVLADSNGVRVLDITEIGVRNGACAYVVDDERLIEVRKRVEVIRTRAHIVEFGEPVVPELMLNAEAPLLNHRSGVVWVHRANMERGQVIEVNGARIEEVRGKA